MKRYDLTYEELYKIYGDYKNEVAYNVTDKIFVEALNDNLVPIRSVVCKTNRNVIQIRFEDGDVFECSEEHLFSSNGECIKAINATQVDTKNNKKTITQITSLGKENVFDIEIDNPHWYISDPESGIIHHNTFFLLGIIKNFLNINERGGVILFESEGSITKDILESRGIDIDRVYILPVETIQQFKTQAIRIVDKYLETDVSKREPLFLALDSLGMLSTTKEMSDSESGKEVKDMTRTAEIKAAFRVLTLKLSKAKLPLVVTNHVYQGMGMFATKELSGGSGLKYSANNIIFLSKGKDKDEDGKVIGNRIFCKNIKSRLTKENTQTTVLLSYERGLNRYYGLVDIALVGGVFKKVSTQIQLPNGEKVFEKTINQNPEKYFTEDILKQIDEAAKKQFSYGMNDFDVEETEEKTDDAATE